MKVELCKVAEIPADGEKLVPFFGRTVHVYRAGAAIQAAMSICTHLGGPLERRGARLVCQWHGAEFDCATGAARVGPAPLGSRLMMLPTAVEDGALLYVWGEPESAPAELSRQHCAPATCVTQP